jgi:5-methylcytosine-specific restriction endonuclease McrA
VTPVPRTVREQVAWSYANLARAHAALADGATRYQAVHHAIRRRLYRGLSSGAMSMRSLYDDERLKLTTAQACCYCGATAHLVVDHLVPRIRGGPDEADNLVWACRTCNSSKQGRELLAWTRSKGFFPSILLLRRYIKLVARYCEANGQMDTDLEHAPGIDVPFDVRLLPTEFPPLAVLTLWVQPSERETPNTAGAPVAPA